MVFFFKRVGAPRALPSFPTRLSSDLVQNLLTFARQHKPERTPTSVNQVLDDTLELRGYELRVRGIDVRSEEHTSELQSQSNLVCRLLLEKKKSPTRRHTAHPAGATIT